MLLFSGLVTAYQNWQRRRDMRVMKRDLDKMKADPNFMGNPELQQRVMSRYEAILAAHEKVPATA